MSDSKLCQWCRIEYSPSYGRFRQGQWICFNCFAETAGFVKSHTPSKCNWCQKKVSEGAISGKQFFCVTCSGNPHLQQPNKSKKKKKKQNYVHTNSNPSSHDMVIHKKKNKEEEVKIEKWKVVIEDISTGDL